MPDSKKMLQINGFGVRISSVLRIVVYVFPVS